MALGSTQHLTEVNIWGISLWGEGGVCEGGRCIGLATLPPFFMHRLYRNLGSLNLVGPSEPVEACAGIALPRKQHKKMADC